MSRDKTDSREQNQPAHRLIFLVSIYEKTITTSADHLDELSSQTLLIFLELRGPRARRIMVSYL